MLKLGNCLLRPSNFQLLNKQLPNGFNRIRHSSSSYEGDGKTKVKVLNNDLDLGLMINTYNEFGFRLNNDFNIVGPMVIFPRTVLAWNVNSVDDITANSLRLFIAMEPKPELLIIGTGDEPVTRELIMRIFKILKPHKISFEMLKTDKACATFNFLNADSRYVAAALLPPKKPFANDMKFLIDEKRREEIYGDVDPDFTKKITS